MRPCVLLCVSLLPACRSGNASGHSGSGHDQSAQGMVTEAAELYPLLENGFQWSAHPHVSNFLTWNSTPHHGSRRVIICGLSGVATTSLLNANFDPLTKYDATHTLLKPQTVRAVLVRSPFERFASWYSERIAGGEASHVEAYNSFFFHTKNDSNVYPPVDYARAIVMRPHGAWDLEFQLAPMTRMCHLGILQYDVIGALERLPLFWKAVQALGGALPPALRDEAALPRMNHKDHQVRPEDYCEMEQALRIVYQKDLLWLRKFGTSIVPEYFCSTACKNASELPPTGGVCERDTAVGALLGGAHDAPVEAR